MGPPPLKKLDTPHKNLLEVGDPWHPPMDLGAPTLTPTLPPKLPAPPSQLGPP